VLFLLLLVLTLDWLLLFLFWARRPLGRTCNLAAHFREILPGVPIVASLRRQDKDVTGADYNLPADNPPLWVRTVRRALTGVA
jgi:hypothetical protein